MLLVLIGIALIITGIIIIRNPGPNQPSIWIRFPAAVRTLSETDYRKFMRFLDVVQIVVGIALVIASFVQ